MSSHGKLLAAGIAVSVLAALAFWLGSDARVGPAQRSRPAPVLPRHTEPAQAATTPHAPEVGDPQHPTAARTDADAYADDRADEASEEPSAPNADLRYYAIRPMSAVPHRVIRGWGASDDPSHLGLVGAYVIVDPGISDEQLTELCRDIQAYHRSAPALSVKILDLEAAATYDRHSDGGELMNQHLLATVNSDARLGVGEVRVRGRLLEEP